MKKILYISLLIIGVTAVSCEKQVFTPNEDRQECPDWQHNDGPRTPGDGMSDDDDTDGGGLIVDPNNEGDGKKKKPN